MVKRPPQPRYIHTAARWASAFPVFWLVVAASAMTAASSEPAVGQTRVMALGDSLTAVPYYRTRFISTAVAQARRIVMVGPHTDTSATFPYAADDALNKHAGFSGQTIGQINASVKEMMAAHKPDVVLLQIGTNNMNHGLGAPASEIRHYPNDGQSSLAAELRPPLHGSYLNGLGSRWSDAQYGTTYLRGELVSLFSAVVSDSPGVRLVVGKIPPIGRGNAAHTANNDNCVERIKEYNSLIQSVVEALPPPTRARVVVIDNFGGVDRSYGEVEDGHAFGPANVQTADWVHPQPNSDAWTRMGNNFYRGFERVMAERASGVGDRDKGGVMFAGLTAAVVAARGRRRGASVRGNRRTRTISELVGRWLDRGVRCMSQWSPGRGHRRRPGVAVLVGATLLGVSGVARGQSSDFRFARYGSYYTFPADSPSAGDARVWVSTGGGAIRGAIVLDDLPKSRADLPHFRNAAQAMGFALIASDTSFSGMTPAKTQQTVDAMMSAAAAASGRPELATAPLAIMGFSGGGDDAMEVATRYPSRTIAYVANRIYADPYGLDNTSAFPVNTAQSGWEHVPGLYVAGASDNNQRPSGVFDTVIRNRTSAAYDAYREKGGRAAMGVIPGYGHSDESGDIPPSVGYEMAFYWFAKAAEHRLPTAATATGQAPVLRTFADGAGWLGDADRYVAGTAGAADMAGGTSGYKMIGPVGSYAGNAADASWLMDADTAHVYRAFASNDLRGRWPYPAGTPLVFSSISPLQHFDVGATVLIQIDPRDFGNGRSITRIEFYDGATLLGTDLTPTGGWTLPHSFTQTGVRGLNVIAYGSDGSQAVGLRVVSVVPEPTFGVAMLGGALVLLRRRSVTECV